MLLKGKPIGTMLFLKIKTIIWAKTFRPRRYCIISLIGCWYSRDCNKFWSITLFSLSMMMIGAIHPNSQSIISSHVCSLDPLTEAESRYTLKRVEMKQNITFKCLYLCSLQTTWKPFNVPLLTSYLICSKFISCSLVVILDHKISLHYLS